jgi:hypothetical protein
MHLKGSRKKFLPTGCRMGSSSPQLCGEDYYGQPEQKLIDNQLLPAPKIASKIFCLLILNPLSNLLYLCSAKNYFK